MSLSISAIAHRFLQLANDQKTPRPNNLHSKEESIAHELLQYALTSIARYEKYLKGLDEIVDHVAAGIYDCSDRDNISVPAETDFVPIAEIDRDRRSWTFEEMKRVVDFKENNPTCSFARLQHNFCRLSDRKQLTRFKSYVNTTGTTRERICKINTAVSRQFSDARSQLLPVHDRDLKRWAQEKARSIGTRFSASQHWAGNLKRKYRIVSRKATKITTTKNLINAQKIEEAAAEFRRVVLVETPNYRPDQIFNSDQSGYNYEYHSTRTLSALGEKSTALSVASLNKVTHSYTIQPLLDYSGRLRGKLYVCLYEPAGKMGPRVEASYFRAPNLDVTCSASGKLTSSLFKRWIDLVLTPQIDAKCLLLLDAWSGQKDEQHFAGLANNASCKVLTIPPHTTAYAQPLDVFYFRQWKLVVKLFYERARLDGIDLNLYERDNILKLQSLVHNQFSSDKFIPMGSYAWFAAGLRPDNPRPFKSASEILFPSNSTSTACCRQNCTNSAFIRCSHCDTYFCFSDFFISYHTHF